MAPEILINRVKNEHRTKVDVYSFGIILHEVFFEKLPYRTNDEQFESVIALGNRVVGGLRPSILDDSYSTAETMYLELMKQCWHSDPEKRPTFDTIVAELIRTSQVV
jgi:serine/threonine protein kinase